MVDLSGARHAPSLMASSAVSLLPDASRFVLRGTSEVMVAAGAALGLNISDTACRSTQSGTRAALWQGPDEQLLLAQVADGAEINRLLGTALAGMPHSTVDVSDRQIGLEVNGPTAEDVLNAGCPLDLHLRSFPIGMCTRTVMGKADIVLWRTGATAFHVEVWRSFADYISRFLAEAARDLAC